MRFASIVLYTLKLEKAKGYISASTVVLPSKLMLGSQQYNSRQIEPNCCAPLWPSDDDDIDDADDDDDDYGDDDNDDDDDSCTSRGDLRNWLRRPELCRVSSSLLYFSLIMLVILILLIIIIIISIVVVNIVIIIIICVIVIAALSAVITKGSLLGVQEMLLGNISHLFLEGLELGKGEDEGVNA